MISTLIGINSLCAGIVMYLNYKNSKVVKLQLVSKRNGFRHYRVKGS